MSSDLADNFETLSILKERDLHPRLPNLGRQTEIAPFLDGAPALIVDMTDARQRYLELYDDDYQEQGCLRRLPAWNGTTLRLGDFTLRSFDGRG